MAAAAEPARDDRVRAARVARDGVPGAGNHDDLAAREPGRDLPCPGGRGADVAAAGEDQHRNVRVRARPAAMSPAVACGQFSHSCAAPPSAAQLPNGPVAPGGSVASAFCEQRRPGAHRARRIPEEPAVAALGRDVHREVDPERTGARGLVVESDEPLERSRIAAEGCADVGRKLDREPGVEIGVEPELDQGVPVEPDARRPAARPRNLGDDRASRRARSRASRSWRRACP